jgi:hypothetical protein
MDTIVDRSAVDVLRIRADMKGNGPKAAFDALESKLPSLKGRKFFGTIRMLDDGEEYYACVEKLATDNPEALGLEVATIPGGRYVRRRVRDWESVVAAGKMKEISQEFARGYELDPDRPSIEFYRSMDELHILLPLATPAAPPTK